MTASSVDSLIRAVAAAPVVDAPPTAAEVKQALAGRYSIERVLGEGGMGVVYLAREVELDRLVALKIVRPSLARDQRFRARLIEEAKTAAKLAHPNIVPVHRIDEIGGILVMAMGYVAGESLRETLRRRGALRQRRTIEILRDVARALAHAHAHGIVHRDIKPDNILIEKKTGRVVVADFGIAAARGAADTAGTRRYMSPEQEAGGHLDGTSDLYSLAMTACEMIAGEVPEPGRVEPVVGVPAAVGELLDRMKSPDSSMRPESAAGVADALTFALEGSQVAPELRNWARTPPGIGAGFVAIGAFVTISPLGNDAAPWLLPCLLAYPLLRHLQRAPRLLRDGYDLDDLRAALAARGDEIRGDSRRSSAARLRLIRFASVAFAAAILLSIGALIAQNILTSVTPVDDSISAHIAAKALQQRAEIPLATLVMFWLALASVLASIGALVGIVVDNASETSSWERATLALRRAFWSTRAAVLWARLVGTSAAPVHVEAELAVAATALLARRAPHARAGAIVGALERAAADARAAGDSERLERAVAHLERLKLALERDDGALDEIVAEVSRALAAATTFTS
jgi:predicted Ser/Thr protein kinase